MTERIFTDEYKDSFIPMDLWGKDHWSLLAYISCVMEEFAGFQVGFDGRMRQNRRNFRIMKEQAPVPKRVNNCMGIVMKEDYSTRLKNGVVARDHDDWCCVQDMATAGLFQETVEKVEPNKILHFSDKGIQISNALRVHKMRGGVFSNFTWEELVNV